MIEGLTKSQVENLVEFIEFHFIDSVRNDPDIDNINYVVDMMEALTKLRATLAVMKENDKNITECPYNDMKEYQYGNQAES